MKTLGLIGGIAPESTVDDYRRLVAACRERGGYPAILINSIDLTKMLALASTDPPRSPPFSWRKSTAWRAPAPTSAPSPPTPRTSCSTKCSAPRPSRW